MSFKREGDDQSQLNILKKRRVADLLSHFIPEDEAALLKNGRYTCLVCSYRPVFDTVDMLTVHRKGKRHLEGLKWYYGKKTDLKNEVAKRQHEQYVQEEDSRQEPSSSAPLLTQTKKLTHHALLKTVPYNSCHRKPSTNSERGSASNSSGPKGSSPNSMPTEQHTMTTEADKLPPDNKQLHPSKHKNGSQPGLVQDTEPLTAQRRQELEHYLKLKSDGWIQDKSGQWVKDENVEFDSDEEEPPPLAPLPQ